jgi:hypothetical protein
MLLNETIRLNIKFVNGKPMGIWLLRDTLSYKGRVWWSEEKTIEVPTRDWMNERISIRNIEWYIQQYEDNPKWFRLI